MGKDIINYLKEELDCYEAILSLTRRQRDALIKGKDNAIGEIIKEKDILINKVKEIDKNIERLSAVGYQPSVKSLMEKIETILRETVEIENECRRIIVNNMNSLSNDIKGLGKGKQIARGYSEKGIYTPKFIRTKT